MYIKSIHITSFGPLKEKHFALTPGLNIFEGPNESGKSSIAMFIKFMLYGLSGRSVGGEMAEQKKYASWDTGCAAGVLLLCDGEREYRIERELYVPVDQPDKAGPRERVAVTDALTGERLFRGEVPGVALFGMTEQMFCNSIFVRQLKDNSIDGTGMAEAIENILLSGDEGLNSRKAAERLDRERKKLLYKNGAGGKIHDLQQELRRLEGLRREATEKNGEVIALESALADNTALIDDRKKKGAQLSALSAAYDTLQRKARLDAALACQAETGTLKEQLEAFASYGDIGEKIQTMERLSDNLKNREAQLRTMRRSLAAIDDTLPPEMTEEEEADVRAQQDRAKAARRGRKSAFAVSLILFVLTAIAGCAAFFLREIDTALAVGAVIFAGIVAICGIVSFVRSLSRLETYHTILKEWGVSDTEALGDAVLEKIQLSRQRTDPASDFCTLEREIAEVQKEADADTQTLRNCAALFTKEVPDTDIMTENAQIAAKELLTEKSRLQEAYHTAAGRLSAFADVLDPRVREEIETQAAATLATEAGQISSRMSREEAEKARRDAGFFRSTAETGQARQVELEKKLSALRAVTASPAELAERIDALQESLSALQRRYNGIAAAIEALETAGNHLREGLLPRIVSEAGVLLGIFSKGKYPSVGVSKDFSMRLIVQDKVRDLEYLSAGTQDAAYISLRYALLNVLFPGNPPPAIFDESFARIDASRLSRILTMLSAAGEKGNQSLLFSCRQLEGELAKDLIRADGSTDQVISLGKEG